MRTVACFLAAAALAAAQQFVNADVKPVPSKNLAADVRTLGASETPAWIGWTAPQVPGHRQGCPGAAQLEEGSASTPDPEEREAGNVVVLVRAQRGAIQRVRAFSQHCRIYAGGRTVYMLTGVRPADGIALLAPLATGEDRKLSDGAVFAIAIQADPAADAALGRFLEPKQPQRLREQTVFWLGAARGRSGYERLRKIVRDDPSDAIRDKAVFALYVSKEPEAVDAIIAAAKNDTSPRVRGQALFWLAQKAANKSAAAIADAIQNDPDTDVKKKAVFALSQLHDGEGVPKLIEVARTNRNAAVRKQAMFWLGQSKDPRALEFFEDILKRP